MPSDDDKPLDALGFLTVVEHEPHGLFGGYLVLNAAGRPLEFHCTAPVKPNRAQQILYGPTLAPYLYGEQIGQTLVRKAKTAVPVVFTDSPPALALREFVSIPAILVLPDLPENGADPAPSDPAEPANLIPFNAGPYRLAIAAVFQQDRESLAARLDRVAAALDLAEPFQRIRDAIAEANRAAA